MSFTARDKIKTTKGRQPTPFEDSVAQCLLELQQNNSDLKTSLKNLHISAAKEVEVPGNKKSIAIFVPFRLLKEFHQIQGRLVPELEKKLGTTVVLVAQRRIQRPGQTKQKRPISRTLKAVHESILEDIVYPVEITGKRTRVDTKGHTHLKVYLDPREEKVYEGKLDSYSAVYQRLTGRSVTFLFQ